MYQVKLHQNVLTNLGSIESANEQPEKRSDGIEFSNDTNRRLTGRPTKKQHVPVGELAMPPETNMLKVLSQKMEKTPRKNFMHSSNTKNKASQESHHCMTNTAKLKLMMKKLQKY